MAGQLIVAGLGLAALGYAGRHVLKAVPSISEKVMKQLRMIEMNSFMNSRYYKGGFEPRMTRREAGLILGISPSSSKAKVKEAHKRVMALNHPDRGGSPLLASKINEAKDLLDGGDNRIL